MALTDQKSIAKALIKLNLTTANANAMAAATGVDATLLAKVAAKLPTGEALTPQETDVMVASICCWLHSWIRVINEATSDIETALNYSLWPIAVVLALCGAWALDGAV